MNPISDTTVHQIPIDAIDEAALSRDRIGLEAAAQMELQSSIALHGLRMPVEVCALSAPVAPIVYGLVSGFRRLSAFRSLREIARDKARYATIPAFVRQPQDYAAALVAMVEENEIRAEISPWERGRVAVIARNQGVYPSVETAVDELYANASRLKRTRLRALARLVEALDGVLTAPETLSQVRALRIAGAVRGGYGEVIATALEESRLKDPESQWALIQPFLAEAERDPEGDLRRATAPSTGGRPRRVLRPRHGLTVRREMTRDGWVLRFSGREATGMLIDTVMDEIERMFSPG